MLPSEKAIEIAGKAIKQSGVRYTHIGQCSVKTGTGFDVSMCTNNQDGWILLRPIGTSIDVLEDRIGESSGWVEIDGFLVSPIPKDNETGKLANKFKNTLESID